jgi:glycosyltransferase involved in cell wall biosynthesis
MEKRKSPTTFFSGRLDEGTAIPVTLHLKLSIVIPTYNRRDVLLSRALPAIFAQSMPFDEYEVIVIVDGSTDGTSAALRDYRPPGAMQVLEQSHRGPGAARNVGIAAARSPTVLFLDDDIVCGPDLLSQHAAAHPDEEPVVVHGSLSLAPESPRSVQSSAIDAWYKAYFGHIESRSGLSWPQDDYLISNSSIPRATLTACGGFDENMPAKEDYELGLRLWKAGVKFKYLPAAVAHEYSVKPARHVLWNDAESFGRSEVLLSRKHPEYRPHSALATLGNTAWWTRFTRRIVLQCPVSPAYLLSLPILVCEKLSRFSVAQRAGLRLLGIGRRITLLRAGLRATGSWNNFQREFVMRLPVLLYRRVGPLRPGLISGLSVSPERFERQVRWLARRGYTGIRPSDWLLWRREARSLPSRPVLLTFGHADDDLTEYVLPVLRRHGFGAGVFMDVGETGQAKASESETGSGTPGLLTPEQIDHWASHGFELGARYQVARDHAQSVYDLDFGTGIEEGINDLSTDPFMLRRTIMRNDDSFLALESRLRWGRNPLQNLFSRAQLH